MVDEVTADCALDVRLARRLKRRSVTNQQYAHNSRSKCAKKNDQKEDCDMMDDEYRNFLNNYSEPVDASDGDVDVKFVDNGHNNDNNVVSRCKWLDEGVDPDYMIFLQHLIVDGRSYKLEMSLDSGIKVAMKYEEDYQLSVDGPQLGLKNYQKRQNTGTTRCLRSASKIDKVENPEKLGTISDSKNISLGDLNASSREILENPLKGNPAKESQVPSLEEEFSLDNVEPNHRSSEKSDKISGKDFLPSIELPCKSDSESNEMDEDYKTFLTEFIFEDDQLSYTPTDDRSILYEHEKEGTSDSEVMMMDIDPCKRSSSSFARKSFRTTMDVDSGKFLQGPGKCNSSGFRERLMQVLKRPYDPDEYELFLEEASCRRQHLRHRNLRGGVVKSYPLGSFAKSYLDLYVELAMKIDLVRYDRPRILNLLRGFFYWLQNLSHEDAFQPWTDPACLNVLPQP